MFSNEHSLHWIKDEERQSARLHCYNENTTYSSRCAAWQALVSEYILYKTGWEMTRSLILQMHAIQKQSPVQLWIGCKWQQRDNISIHITHVNGLYIHTESSEWPAGSRQPEESQKSPDGLPAGLVTSTGAQTSTNTHPLYRHAPTCTNAHTRVTTCFVQGDWKTFELWTEKW